MHLSSQLPCSCDTFVSYYPTSPRGKVVFGKNSDRPNGEGQSIRRYPATTHYENNAEVPNVDCTYISIPQVPKTYSVILSQIDWMWGCENGANEYGVVIGNEAVWTKVKFEKSNGEYSRLLLGMDLVRLGLERGKTSREACDVITDLLEKHGQGGPCAFEDNSFTYHNSFLIADRNEAWILETAGRHWVAQRWSNGARNISNGLTIRTQFDLHSKGIHEYAKKLGLWDGKKEFDFAAVFSEGGLIDADDDYSRQVCGEKLLAKYENSEKFGKEDMIGILRNCESGICMYGDFETTASMVSEITDSGCKHYFTGKPDPCKSEYILQDFL